MISNENVRLMNFPFKVSRLKTLPIYLKRKTDQSKNTSAAWFNQKYHFHFINKEIPLGEKKPPKQHPEKKKLFKCQTMNTSFYFDLLLLGLKQFSRNF